MSVNIVKVNWKQMNIKLKQAKEGFPLREEDKQIKYSYSHQWFLTYDIPQFPHKKIRKTKLEERDSEQRWNVNKGKWK